MESQNKGSLELHWSIYASASAAVLLLAYWLFSPTSHLVIAVPLLGDPPSIHVGKIDLGANRRSFALRVRWLDAKGLSALRRGEYQTAADYFSQSLEAGADNPRAHTNRAAARILLGDLEDARVDYEAAIMQEPRLKDILLPLLSKAFYKRGHDLVEARKTKEAREILKIAVDVDPKNATAHLEIASLDILAGQYQTCIDHINEAVRINPQLKLAYDNRGACYSGLGKYPEALEDLNKALLLYPNRAETYGTRAGVHIWLKNYAKAIADAHKAIELKPGLEKSLAPIIEFAENKIKK